MLKSGKTTLIAVRPPSPWVPPTDRRHPARPHTLRRPLCQSSFRTSKPRMPSSGLFWRRSDGLELATGQSPWPGAQQQQLQTIAENEPISSLPLSTHSAIEMLHDAALYVYVLCVFYYVSCLWIFVFYFNSAERWIKLYINLLLTLTLTPKASVPITVLLYNDLLLCGFNFPITGLTWRTCYLI